MRRRQPVSRKQFEVARAGGDRDESFRGRHKAGNRRQPRGERCCDDVFIGVWGNGENAAGTGDRFCLRCCQDRAGADSGRPAECVRHDFDAAQRFRRIQGNLDRTKSRFDEGAANSLGFLGLDAAKDGENRQNPESVRQLHVRLS